MKVSGTTSCATSISGNRLAAYPSSIPWYCRTTASYASRSPLSMFSIVACCIQPSSEDSLVFESRVESGDCHNHSIVRQAALRAAGNSAVAHVIERDTVLRLRPAGCVLDRNSYSSQTQWPRGRLGSRLPNEQASITIRPQKVTASVLTVPS